MNQRLAELKVLARLVDAAYAAEQSQMASLKRQEFDLRSKVDALRPNAPELSVDPAENPALFAGADLLWQRWADGRRADLNAELARTLVAQAQAKTRLATAFGRNEAIKSVVSDALKDMQELRKRRSERPD